MIRLSTGAINALLSTGSFKTVFANAVLCVYSGTQPATADAAETGSLLATVTVDAGAFVPGAATNGLNFDAADGKRIAKAAAETWKGIYGASGTMGWFRLYANDKATGDSTTGVRVDGSIGTSRTDVIVASTATTSGGSISFDEFALTFNNLT